MTRLDIPTMNHVNSQSVGSDNDADLDWLAYQYVAGELREHDALAFEGRLAVDQSAREALAAAVALSQAIAIAGEACITTTHHANQVSLTSREKFWLKPVGSLVASAAAALLVGGMLQLFWPTKRQPESPFDASLLAECTQLRDVTADDWSAAA